jgi:hypothetical protein
MAKTCANLSIMDFEKSDHVHGHVRVNDRDIRQRSRA